MIEITLFYNTFIGLLLIILTISFIIYKIKKTHRITFWFIGLLECYLLVLFQVVILPIKIIYDTNYYNMIRDYIEAKNYLQLVPFHTIIQVIMDGTYLNIQIIGNLLLFFPLPIFIAFLMKNYKLSKLIMTSCLFSVVTETIQFILNKITGFPSRICDIDDIILNCIGIFIGIGFYYILLKLDVFYNFICNYIIYTKQQHTAEN